MDSTFNHILTFESQTPSDTEALAHKLCQVPKGLRAGDLVALVGAIGMGKSVFARSVIRILSGDMALDVPSPTFTLVQGYQSVDARKINPDQVDIMHCDLYRLNPGEGLDDLLLDEMREKSLILVEWPDRLPAFILEKALVLRFTARDNASDNSDVPNNSSSTSSSFGSSPGLLPDLTSQCRRIEIYGNPEWGHRLKPYTGPQDCRKAG